MALWGRKSEILKGDATRHGKENQRQGGKSKATQFYTPLSVLDTRLPVS